MRWLITLLLLVLVAVGGAVLLFPDKLLPAVGLATPAPEASAVLAELAKLTPDAVRKITVTHPDQPPLVFEKVNGVWVQAGGMDLRQDEVNELVATACGLHTRYTPFTPEPGTDTGFAPASKPIQILLESAPGQSQLLTLGRPKPTVGEAEFGQPAFVKVGTTAELLRVGPEAFAVVSRPAETYLRKQLFADARRARFNETAAPGQPPLASEARKLMFDDGVKSIEVSGPDGRYTLTRFANTPTARRDPATRSAEPAMLPNELADAWKITAPTEDRIDPAKLKTILTALPDLWVERFIDPEPLADAFTDFLRNGTASVFPTAVLQQSDRAALREYVLSRISGFTKEAIEKQKKEIENGKRDLAIKAFDAERVVTVTPADGRKRPVTLRIGAVSRVSVRKEMGPPMGMFPGTEREIKTEYRFAKFDGNGRVFEVKAEKVGDVFVKADDLADPKLAHFTPDEVASVTITAPRQFLAAAAPFAALSDKPLSVVALKRVKGKPSAATEKAKRDRWFIGDRLAESGEVTALLDALSKMEAKAAEDRPHAVAAPGIATTVTVEVEPKVADGDDARPKKMFTFQIAGRDPLTGKLAVRVDGWARLNWVDLSGGAFNPMAPPPPPGPAADELALRPVAVYRSKQLFDTADSTLDRMKVTPDSAAFLAGYPAALGGFFGISPPPVPTGFELQLPTGDGKWALTAPVTISADEAASKLAADLGELKAVEEVADAPTDAQLAEFGLTKPRLAVVLGFRGTDARTETLALGGDVPKKGEVYARRNNVGGVFTVPKAVADALSGGAESLLPKQPWAVVAEKVTSLGVKRGPTPDDSYTLARGLGDPKAWTLAGPFAVSADAPQAEALAAAVAALKATKYEPLTVPDARRAKYGLDQPAARLAITATDKDDEKKTVAYALLIGNKVGDTTDRYAKLEGANGAVFVVADAVLAAADKSAIAYLDRRLLNLDVSKITKVQLSDGAADSAVTLVNAGKGWKPDGAAFPVDEPTVFALTGAAARLTALKLVAYGNAVNAAQYGFDKPAHTLTLTVTGEAAPVVIQLGKEEPSGERFVRVDGKPGVGLVSGFVAAAMMKGKLDVIDRGLLNFDPLLVTGVTRAMGKDEFELAPAGRGWEVAKPKKFKADTQLIEALAGEVGFLRATKVAAFAPPDLKPFGLDAPAATVTFKVDGKDQTLKLGKPVDAAKPNEDRYAAVAGSQVVAVIPGAVANKLLAEPVKFSDRTLNPNRFVDADKVVVTRDGRTATFVKKDGLWKMTAPAEATAETNELEEFIAIAAQLRAEELVANDAPPEKLKELGFDPPQGRIVISNADKEVLNLLIGNKEKTGPRVPVKLDKAGLIGLLDAPTSAKATAEFRTRAAWPAADGAQAETLAFSGNGDFAFRKKDATAWEDTTPPLGIVDAGKVSDAVAVLANLKAERYVVDKDAKLALYGLDKPKRVIVLTLKGGEKRVLHLGNPVGGAAGKQVYAKVDDKDRTDVFILSEADTAKLTGERKAFGK